LRPAMRVGASTTLGPDYKRPAIALPAQYTEPSPAEGPTVAPDWWRLYSDATLDDLVASGQKTNADVRLAAARVQEAEGVLREARAASFPDGSAGAPATRRRRSA